MNRVELAIQEGRCVLVFGSRALQDAEAIGELRRRAAIPSVVLGTDIPSPAVALSPASIAPALAKEGGMICLVDIDAADGAGLGVLAQLVGASPHKPRLTVVARSFNPFLLPQNLRLLKLEHDKKRARDFLFTLPVPAAPAPVVVAAPVEEPKKKAGAPRSAFVGREDELASLGATLQAGGPVVVVGPWGIGKHWLVERALTQSGLTRVPDFMIAWGCEADSLYARIAAITAEVGDKRLGDALNNPNDRPAPAALAALAVEALGNPALAGKAMVIERLEHVMRRDGTFHREGRLELLLKALLLCKSALRLVILSTIRPRFYREGEGVGLPVLELGGLKARDLHEIFESYRVEDFPRAHYGDIINRIHGHPFAARMFAVAVRDPEQREGLMENRRFFQMDGVADLDTLRKRVLKALEGLPEDERKALATLAHFRLPFTAADCEAVGVDRRLRLALAGRGLLDSSAEERERTWSVHPIVRSGLEERETSEFGTLERLGELYLERASKSQGLVELALAQEGNRFLFAAHRIRNRYRMPFPDHDPSLESIRGMVRSKKGRPDLAQQRIEETLRMDPANTEVQLLKVELMIEQKAPPEMIAGVFTAVEQRSPTPEAFHAEATWNLMKSSGRGRAASALERGIAVWPESGRMRRRLAGIYLDQNRVDDAVTQLEEAMRLEPMMPDTYGILGEIFLSRGAAYYERAEQMLAEARRLDPDNGLHMARLGAFYAERGEKLAEAEALLEEALKIDRKNYLANLYLARLILNRDGDAERADWLLKGAHKLAPDAAAPLVERARLDIKFQRWTEAAAGLERALKIERGSHEAFYQRGVLFEAQLHVFNADQDYRRALELSPKGSQARTRYEEAVARMAELIQTGKAVELQKMAEEAAAAAGTPVVDPGQRREPGTTVQRRRRGRGRGEGAPAEGAQAEGAPTEVAAVEGGEPAAEPARAPVDPGAVEGELIRPADPMAFTAPLGESDDQETVEESRLNDESR